MLRLAVFASSVLAVSCFPLLPGQDSDLSGQEVRLTFLHTSDIHSRLLPYDFAPLKTDTDLGLIPEAGPFGGVTRLASLIKRERANADRVIHLDSGDSFEGAPIFNVNKGEAEYRFLSQVHVDAAVIGNHEFDLGALNFTNQAKNNATFPVLAANYFWDDPKQLDSNKTALYTQPYTLKNIGGVRVGIIGMANLGSLNSIVEGGNSLQVTPLEQNEAARGYVELLKPLTDLVVIVSHAGLTEDQDLIQGYEAFYEYGRAKSFIERSYQPWQVLEWFGEEGAANTVVRVFIPGVIGVDLILGGHLHIILNPPQKLVDPSGRQVILAHGGAFSKYLGRLDVVVQMPPKEGATEMAEVVSHDYRVFPVDSLWCNEALHRYYTEKFWAPGAFAADPQVRAGIAECTRLEDPDTTQLLLPYVVGLDVSLNLTSLFGYAPRDIARRNNSSGGDSPLGNLCADSMRKRKRVEAEVAVTNSLGIRDNLYAGPLTQESMFNVFPFENTINVMYLSGGEMQEMLDFIAERSAERGCVSQAQVSGIRFTMDCAQVQLNNQRTPCDPSRSGADNGKDCPGNRDNRAPWQCIDDGLGGGRCWAHSGVDVSINGQPLDTFTTYRVAVNDYIAKGGSGFTVLKRNTTRVETGIPLRDSLIGYMQGFCSCEDLLADHRDSFGNVIGKHDQLCGTLLDGQWVVDSQVLSYCRGAQKFQDALTSREGLPCSCAEVFRSDTKACGESVDFNVARTYCFTQLKTAAAGAGGPNLGKCQCVDALAGNPLCGNVTSEVRAFCENPSKMAVAIGVEDARIKRRVK
ncbi:MAG: bifunctional metallophosphatase/5'-nucleotidase [Archangiaceae bacterium]|nr:bifunctional metallophosphatase/5'-nucleotidase [Archangiaceae bacterium]